MVNAAKSRLNGKEILEQNLLNAMVQKNEEARKNDGMEWGGMGKSRLNQGLSDEEVNGNLFICSSASHETTAHTLAPTFYNLVANPEWQEWVGEEIDRVFKEQDSPEKLDFQVLFPQLERCLSVMVHEFPFLSVAQINC